MLLWIRKFPVLPITTPQSEIDRVFTAPAMLCATKLKPVEVTDDVVAAMLRVVVTPSNRKLAPLPLATSVALMDENPIDVPAPPT